MVGTGENLCPEFHEEAVTDQKGVYRLRGLSVSVGVMAADGQFNAHHCSLSVCTV